MRSPTTTSPSHGGETARRLDEDAPFGLLAHDTSADPIFIYANSTAQRCFEYTWHEFVRLPFRLSAAMWNLVDADGSQHGQTAVFRSWTDVSEDRTGG
ncbi:MEKHLA domain-containing protein [Streptomyces mirabilis]|uniref:MEKHLA domain-containing protein n=1 Tax=Streptomyces mirabilis TaxID=68239 RepID=UPI0036AA4191